MVFCGSLLRLCQLKPFRSGQNSSRMGIDQAVIFRCSCCIFRRRHGFQASADLIHQNIACRRKRMDRRGKRRRICKIHCCEIFHFTAQGNPGNGDIRHLIHGPAPDHLHSQKFMTLFVGNQLRNKNTGIRIIMSLIIADTNNGNDRTAFCFRLFFCQARSRRIQPLRQFHHAGSKAPFILIFFPAKVQCQNPARNISRRTHCRPLSFSGDTIFHQGTVSDGINIGEIRSLAFIGNNTASFHLQSGVFQKSRGRTDTRRQDDHICRQRSCSRPYIFHFPFSFDREKRRPCQDAKPLPLKLPADIIRHLLIENIRHKLGGHIHHRHGNPSGHKIFRHFKPYKAAPYDNGPFASVFHGVFSCPDGIFRRSDSKYTGKSCPVHRRYRGFRPHRNHQPVIADSLFPVFSNGNRLPCRIDCRHFAARMYLRARQSHKFRRSIYNQFFLRPNSSPDVIRKPAPRIRDIFSFCIDHDLILRSFPFQLCGCLRSRRNAAYYYCFHSANLLFIFSFLISDILNYSIKIWLNQFFYFNLCQRFPVH